MRTGKPIMLVEDDEVDVMTVKRAMMEISVPNSLVVAGNGEEALEYLRDRKNEMPCLILLDLNMPKMNGLEFLRIAKHDKHMKVIPVVVLTTSRTDEDKINSFNLGVAGYMIKPVDYRQFVAMMRTLDMYWTYSEAPV